MYTSVSTCVAHVFAKLFLNQFGLHKLLGHNVVLQTHRLISSVEISQQQRLLSLVSEDADCFQKSQPGQVYKVPFNISKPDLI